MQIELRSWRYRTLAEVADAEKAHLHRVGARPGAELGVSRRPSAAQWLAAAAVPEA